MDSVENQKFSSLVHALKLERRLLLLAQNNYRSLKLKFIRLNVDYDHLKETFRTQQNEYENRLFHVDESKEAVQKIVKEIEHEKAFREEQFQLFKSKTLDEIQAIYRVQINALEEEISQLNKQNDHLKKDISSLKSEYFLLQEQSKQFENDLKTQTIRLKSDYDAELLELSNQLQIQSTQTSNVKELTARLENAQTNMTMLSEKIAQMNDEHNIEIVRKDAYIDSLLKKTDAMNSEKFSLDIQFKKLVIEKEELQEKLSIKEKNELILRKNLINFQKEKDEFESMSLAKANEQNIEWTDRCTKLESTVDRLQEQVMDKNNTIKDMDKRIQHIKHDQISNEEKERLYKEENEILSNKIKELELKIREQHNAHANGMAKLRWERDKLEEKPAEFLSPANLKKYIVEKDGTMKTNEEFR